LPQERGARQRNLGAFETGYDQALDLAHKGRAPLEQIQIALGHASIQTTERYLGVEQDLADTPCNHLGTRAGIGRTNECS
jgi:integrase